MTDHCEECGSSGRSLKRCVQSGAGTTKWKRLDYVLTGKVTASGEPQKEIALVQKETCPKELFQYFIKLLEDYPTCSWLLAEIAAWWTARIPTSWTCSLHPWQLRALLLRRTEWNPIPAFWHMNKASLHITVRFDMHLHRMKKKALIRSPSPSSSTSLRIVMIQNTALILCTTSSC